MTETNNVEEQIETVIEEQIEIVKKSNRLIQI